MCHFLRWRVGGMSTMDAYVVSISETRRANLIEQLRQVPNVSIHCVDGLRGAALPDVACLALSDNEGWVKFKGTLGCFLSHVAIWEKIAHSRNIYSIVLEDDTTIFHFDKLLDMVIPEDADIIFIHNKVSPNPRAIGSINLYPFSAGLSRLEMGDTGLGGYGYILTPKGAQKIIASLQNDLFFGHVDGRLLRYSISDCDIANLDKGSKLRFEILNHHNKNRMPAMGILKSYCVAPALVWVADESIPSIREQLDGVAITTTGKKEDPGAA